MSFYRRLFLVSRDQEARDRLICKDLTLMFGLTTAMDIFDFWELRRSSPTHLESLGHILCLHYGVPQQIRLLLRQYRNRQVNDSTSHVDADDVVLRPMRL